MQPFSDLLRAFRQDQIVQRYQTWEDVLDYCVYSANPVGRLVLYLCDYRDEDRQNLSDHTCTALQLANFWQDVSRDLEKGRIYIPLEALAAHGLTEADIVKQTLRCAIRRADEIPDCAHARHLLTRACRSRKRVEPFLRVDLEMFSRGGLAILDAIETSGYNTLEHRPALTKWTQARSPRSHANHDDRLRADRATWRCPLWKSNGSEASRHAEAERDPTPQSAIGGTPYSDSVRASYAECNRIARAARSSFYLAFFGLRKEKRNALCALYAFMRLVDNVSDDPRQPGMRSARASLAGARCSMKPSRAAPAATQFFRRWRTPSRASKSPRATFTI